MKSPNALTGILLFTLSLANTIQAQQPQNPASKALSKSIVELVSGPAVTDLKPAAEKGDPVAQYKLGRAFYVGGDYTNALHWYRQAARQGLADAQFAYGTTFLDLFPQNVPKDKKEGVRWLALAANQNHPLAQLSLSQHIEKGTAGRADKVEAMKWLMVLVNNQPHYRVYVDQLALKMTTPELEVAKQRAASFRPSSAAKVSPNFKLQGISGSAGKRLAIINGKTFGTGERGTVKVDGDSIDIHCVEIGTDFVTIKVKGESIPHMLTL